MSGFGYWTNLSSIQFDEASKTSTFMAMPYGSYDHPVYGKIKLTYDKAVALAHSIINNVRETEVDIDYDHKQHSGKAAGWVKAAEARTDGLYLTVEWTKKARAAIKAGEYKYFSPEFQDEWKHPKTGVVHKNVLFGGGITNRPFLKDILPLNLSELYEERQEKGTGMDPEKLRQLLGLPADATDEQVETALKAATEAGESGNSGNGQEASSEEQQRVAASEALTQEVISLAEKSPAIKALVDQVTALHEQVTVQQTALKLAETSAIVIKLSEPVNNKALPPVTSAKLSEILLDAPKALSDKIVAMFNELNSVGYVQLGEVGSGNSGSGSDGADGTVKFSEAVKKLTDANVTYADAVEQVARENPELFEAHRASAYAFQV